MEIDGRKISLRQALDTLYRFWPSLPHTLGAERPRWALSRSGLEWLSHSGAVLAVSDYEEKSALSELCQRTSGARVVSIPLGISAWSLWCSTTHSGKESVRYREIEYQRMPLMSYLALDEKTRLTRGDLVRLGLVTRRAMLRTLPFSERFLEDFERRYCYDRYWEEAREHDFNDARLISNGHDFTMIGEAREPFFTDAESGMLGQFRHQYFLLFLITHFHKAAC